MAQVGRTYYYKIPLKPHHFEGIFRRTPEYDERQGLEVVRGWWKGNLLGPKSLRVTVHVNALLGDDGLKMLFEEMTEMPSIAGEPQIKHPKWILVRFSPEVMDLSRKSCRRLRRVTDDWNRSLDQFRVDAVREIVLRIYYLDLEP